MKKLVLLLMVIVTVWSCDTEKDTVVVITTKFGEIHMLLYDETPLHKANFLKLANDGYYDSTTFHRIIEGFMIQGGDENSKNDDPNDDGNGGPGYTIPAEFNDKFFHKKGAVAAARLGDNANPKKASSGSQFYIAQGKKYTEKQMRGMEKNANMQKKNALLSDFFQDAQNYKELAELKRHQQSGNKDSMNLLVERSRPRAEKGFKPFIYSKEQIEAYTTIGGTPHLDGGYTVFGEVVRGLEVVDEIARQKKGRADRPVTDIKMAVKLVEMKKTKITEEYGFAYPVTPTTEK